MNEDQNVDDIQLALDFEVEEPTKRCRDCRGRYPLHQFNRQRLNRDGHMSMCRPCDNARSLTWRIQHPGYHAAYSAAWRAARRGAEEAEVVEIDPSQGDLLREAS